MKQKDIKTIDLLANLMWIFFGIIGGVVHYEKAEYIISGIMALIAVLYGYKLLIQLRQLYLERIN